MQAEYAQRYRTLWNEHWWWRSRESLLVGWIERLHRRTPLRRILDVGCGDGLFFNRLERFGDVEGLESDATLLRDPRWTEAIRVGSLGAGFRADKQFDLLLLLDVLEHIENDADALLSAYSALRPGGHLLATVPALTLLWSRHDEVNAHYRRYKPGGLRSVVEAAGFEVETIRFFFFWAVVPMLFRRWLAPGGGGTADYEVTIPPTPINRALMLVSRCDHVLGRFLRWPWGSSLLVIARRPLHRNGEPRGRSISQGGRLLSDSIPGK